MERTFRYFESSLVQVVLGTIGGLSGVFLDGRWYVLLTPLAVVALHRGKVLEGFHRQIQILIYCLASFGIAMSIFLCGINMNGARDKEYAALIKAIRAIPPPSVSTEEWLWPPKPSPAHKQGITSSYSTIGQDELLSDAQKELKNCNDFLSRSNYRETHTYGVSIAIAEDKQDQQFNDGLDKYDLGTKPPAIAKAQHERRQAQIDREEAIFSSQEVNTWENTYGPEFEPVYHKMMAAVGNPRDFDGSNPMKAPDTLGMIKYECSNLGNLIQQYTAIPKP